MPPIGGTVWYCLWAALHSAAGSGGDMAPSIDGTIWPPDRAAQNGGHSTRRMAGTKDAGAPFHCPANRPGRPPPGNRRAARCPAEFRRMSCGAGRGLDRRADPAAAGTPAAACLHAGAMAPAGMVPAGMVPPMGGTISCRRWLTGMVLPIGSTCRPACDRRPAGGGWQGLAGALQRTLGGVLFPGRWGVLFPAGSGAAYRRHGVWCRLLPARFRGGGAWQDPAGALQRTLGGVLVPACR